MKNDFNLSHKINFYWSQIESNLKGHRTWDIFWYSYIFLNNGLCLTPNNSYTKNIGHDSSGVHCSEDKILQNLPINLKTVNKFPHNVIEDPIALKLFIKYFERNKNLLFKFRKALRSSRSIFDLINKIINYFRKLLT